MRRLLAAVLLCLSLVVPAWAERLGKFARVAQFGQRHAALSRQVQQSLREPRADRATAVAAIVRIMDATFMRVGSERYAHHRGRDTAASFGASSLRKEHVSVAGDRVTFDFRGKSGVRWKRSIRDAALATTLRVFLALPGDRLFQVPDGDRALHPVTERDVRPMLARFGALPKDLRTYHANRLLDQELARLGPSATRAEAERRLTAAIGRVARALNHTPSVCRSNYLDPSRIRGYAAQLR